MTKVNCARKIKIRDEEIEILGTYKYFGYNMRFSVEKLKADTRSRIRATFDKRRYIFKSKMENNLKRKVHEMCVYCQSWHIIWNRSSDDNQSISENGHIYGMANDLWTKNIMQWRLPMRPPGRLPESI